MTESASGRFRSFGEAPVGGVLGGNWSGNRWLGAPLQTFCTFLVKNHSVVDVSPFSRYFWDLHILMCFSLVRPENGLNHSVFDEFEYPHVFMTIFEQY